MRTPSDKFTCLPLNVLLSLLWFCSEEAAVGHLPARKRQIGPGDLLASIMRTFSKNMYFYAILLVFDFTL